MGYFVLIVALLLGLFVVVSGVYILKGKPDDPSTDAAPMSLGMRRIILAYFLLLGALLIALLIDLNTLDFPQTVVAISATPTPTPTPTPSPSPSPKSQSSLTSTPSPSPSPTPKPQSSAGTGAGNSGRTTPAQGVGQPPSAESGTAGQKGELVLRLVMPRITTGKAPATYLDVYGTNLTDGQIRINGQVRPTKSIGSDLLETLPDPSDVQGQGSLTVDVISKDTPPKISNCIIVPIDNPTASLSLGWWQPFISREVQLLLIVIVAGALGGLIHSLNSIAVFIGNRSAIASWFWWYITRPLFSMAMALIFYAVLRGGFLAGTPADVKAISPFGVLAIGALVGMFTQKAMGKLTDIFDILFHSKSDDLSKDKAKKVSIKTATLPAGTSGHAYSAHLEALDASQALTWDVSGLPAGLTFDPKNGNISGTITAAAGTSATVKVVANDGPGNSDTKTFTLNVQ